MRSPRAGQHFNQNTPLPTINGVLRALLAVVCLGAIYRYCYIDVADPFKCGALLNKGEWLPAGPGWDSSNSFQNWQPPGCLMHTYEKEDIRECFGRRRLVFLGDSTTRQIFWAMAKKLDQEKVQSMIDALTPESKHQDVEFTSHDVKIQFVWDPWLNSTSLEPELKKFRADPLLDTTDESNESAGLVLLGAPGLWYAREGQENFLRDFKEAVDAVIPFMDHGRGDTASSSVSKAFPAGQKSPNLLLMAPIQVPYYPSLSPTRGETITPEKIDLMNDYLQQVSAHSNADIIWSYSLMTWSGEGEYKESGLHVVEDIATRKADVLLNLRCNINAASKGYPFDRTCCSNYTKPGATQWVVLLVTMFGLPGLLIARRSRSSPNLIRILPSIDTLRAFVIFGLTVCFCFYADRTQIFEKSQRLFREREFVTALLAVAAVGLVSIRRSKGPAASFKQSTTPFNLDILSRDQTDEWKGWMQFFILIYHYTHGSKTIWIYEIVRILVASYLFMTGFGHTLYFLKNNDYSLRRVASVLVRLNLLSCVLPYMMRTDYLFYYFAPLVSFWFLVIYFTLKIGYGDNSNITFLLGKTIVSAILTTAFIMIPGILEFVSFLLKHTCAISWDMTEWRFRTYLDMYVVYVGMIVAILWQRRSQLSSGSRMPTTSTERILQFTITYKRIFKTLGIISSIAIIPTFFIIAGHAPIKQEYNKWHSYVSFLPILAFIILRNSHQVLRNYHSKTFAWLGRRSLETYILQYHIWLAGDSKGLLRVGLWNRWVETALLTVVFLWISSLAVDATQKITAWIVGGGRTNPPPGGSSSGAATPRAGEGASRTPLSILPSGGVQDGEGTPSKDVRFEFGKRGIRPWVAAGILKVRHDLTWSIGFITTILWLGNVTYK